MGEPHRMRLLTGPTPLQRLHALEAVLGTGPLWVKRDDLTGFGVAGNKARTLEFLLGDALAAGAEVLVTGGREGSNFCAAVALAGAVAGIEVRLVMPGEETDRLSATQALAVAAGAEIVRMRAAGDGEQGHGDPGDLDAAIEAHAERLRGAGRAVYVTPRGGATAIGALGYAEAAHELADQLAALEVSPQHVVVAVGTGGTVAGLLTGQAELAAGWSLSGVCVSSPAAELAARITSLSAGCAALRGTQPGHALTLTDAAGAHAVLTEEQERLADLAFTTCGLLLDDTYTAKAFQRAVVLAGRTSRPTVFWHTGGVVNAVHRLTSRKVVV